MGPTKDLQ
jgi:hypothetical protein